MILTSEKLTLFTDLENRWNLGKERIAVILENQCPFSEHLPDVMGGVMHSLKSSLIVLPPLEPLPGLWWVLQWFVYWLDPAVRPGYIAIQPESHCCVEES